MIALPAMGAGEAASDALDQNIVVDVHDDHCIERLAAILEQAVKSLGLGYRTRKTVEDEASTAGILIEALSDQLDDEIVGNEVTALHDLAGSAAELAAGSNRGSQHVPRRELGERTGVFEQLRLGAFARAGRAEQDQVHRFRLAPLSRARLISPSY